MVFTVDFAFGEALIKNFTGCRGQSDAGCIASAVQLAEGHDQHDREHEECEHEERTEEHAASPTLAKSPIVHHGEPPTTGVAASGDVCRSYCLAGAGFLHA